MDWGDQDVGPCGAMVHLRRAAAASAVLLGLLYLINADGYAGPRAESARRSWSLLSFSQRGRLL